jgi:acetyl-CoA C-acetyltransferase
MYRKLPPVFIGAVNRTPLGSFEGCLKSLTAPQLGSLAIRSLLEKTKVSGDKIDEVFFGNVLQGGLGKLKKKYNFLH